MGPTNRTQLLPKGQPLPHDRGPSPHQGHHQPSAPPQRPSRPRRRRRTGLKVFTFLLVLLLAWPIGLAIWANGKLQHVDALSGAPSSPAYTTYLLVGSDSRGDGFFDGDSTEGERADSIMLLTVPKTGAVSLISIPRDTFVEIPGAGANKINASYHFGGPQLLVQTVESFTGMTVDHYAEIGMGGVAAVVDAVGTINLCSDLEVNDPKSNLVWTPGCHDVDGPTALAFGRMRYQDPTGDIGRADRQRQVIQATMKEVASPSMLNPLKQAQLAGVGVGAIAVAEEDSILDVGKLALAFYQATRSDGVRGTPPITTTSHHVPGVGTAVLITSEDASAFFAKVADGSVTTADVH